MENTYKIIRTIFENNFQKVLECKENESGQTFYCNIISNNNLIELIDKDELKKLSSNIIEVYIQNDKLFIFTKPFEESYRSLKDFLTEKLTFKQQFKLSQKIFVIASDINFMSDITQQKILDIDRLYVDLNEDVFVDLNLIFEQDYDISENETLRRMANIVHYIFSGTEIIDYNLSNDIPPDILKIIARCLSKEYEFPHDALTEMMNSPIYDLIFGANVLEEPRKNYTNQTNVKDIKIKEENENIDLVIDKLDDELKNEDDEEKPFLDIYLDKKNANQEDFEEQDEDSIFKRIFYNLSRKDIIKALISILVVIVILLLANSTIKMFNSKKTSTLNNEIKDKTSQTQEQNTSKTNNGEQDSIALYFNDDLLNKMGYSGDRALVDNTVFIEGTSSLLIANEKDAKKKALFSIIDFSDERLSYLLNQQIAVAFKAKSDKELKASVVFESYKNKKLSSTIERSIDINKNNWTQFTIPIKVSNIDALYIYLQYEGINKVWIDSIFIDVIK